MNKKEQYLLKDRLIKGISEDKFFKISVVKTTELVQHAVDKHTLSPLSAVVLGRSLTGTVLMASELKGEERIRLEIQSNGTISYIVAEANALGEVRGYVNNPHAAADFNKLESVGDAIGIGVLSFSKTLYNEARPITGTVELVKGSISEDIAYYLFQSDQVPSAITLDVQIDENGKVVSAGGVLVQALPGAPDHEIEKIQQNMAQMRPVGIEFLNGNYIDTIMWNVMNPLKTREIGRFPVHFFCRCTKDRFLNALEMLHVDELEDMKSVTQELVCHYCNEKYRIKPAEIERIVSDMRIKMN